MAQKKERLPLDQPGGVHAYGVCAWGELDLSAVRRATIERASVGGRGALSLKLSRNMPLRGGEARNYHSNAAEATNGAAVATF
jgi:hypothetical protein